MRKRDSPLCSENRMDDLFNYRLPDRVPIGSMSIGFSTVNVFAMTKAVYDVGYYL